MRVAQARPGMARGNRSGRPDAVWPLRRSPLVRVALGGIAKICVGLLGVVAIFTLFFVWAFGHPVAWSVIGCLFGALPLAGLLLTIGVGARAAVAAGPRWIGVRLLGRWRVIDLGQVRVVRLDDQGMFPGFGASGGFGVPGGFPRFGGQGGPGGRSLVFEDGQGGRVDIGVDALDAGLAAVVRAGLSPDAEVDPDAARALDGTPELESGSGETGGPDEGTGRRP